MIVIQRVLLVVSLIESGLLMSSSVLVIFIISVRKRGISIICVPLLSVWDVPSEIFGGCWSDIHRVQLISSW